MKCKICQKEIDLNSKIKECKNEGEINSLNKNICLDCYRRTYSTFDKNLSYSKFVINFEEDTYYANWSCKKCNLSNRKVLHVCKNCGFKEENSSSFWTCPECGYSKRKENFYKNKINLIEFNYLNSNVKLNEINNLIGKIGVWSRWTDENHGNYCLDVCKTIDIGNEMLSSLRSFNSLKENPNQILDTVWKKKYQKQLDNCKDSKIIFKLVAICETEEEALKIEAQYANENKAKYWNFDSKQNNLY